MRRTRKQYHEESLRLLRPAPVKKTFQEALAMVKRQMKRQAIADGVILDPRLNPPRFEWHWEWPSHDGKYAVFGGKVFANTRSEARSLIKKELGLKKRLPTNIVLVKVDPDANCPTMPNPFA